MATATEDRLQEPTCRTHHRTIHLSKEEEGMAQVDTEQAHLLHLLHTHTEVVVASRILHHTLTDGIRHTEKDEIESTEMEDTLIHRRLLLPVVEQVDMEAGISRRILHLRRHLTDTITVAECLLY